MSYSHYDRHERMREHYEDYMDEKRMAEQQEKSDEDWAGYYTGSGVPLDKLVHVTNIPYYEGGFAAVNWCSLTNEFLICEPGHADWVIPRTEETLRAFARILAFNPKEWGCGRCGCSTELNTDERICWCDTCQKDGCSTPSRLAEHIEIVPRVKSQYFMKRRGSSFCSAEPSRNELPPDEPRSSVGSLPPPPVVPLERQLAVCSSDTFFEPPPISPKSPIPHRLSAEDTVRFGYFPSPYRSTN